MPRFSESDIDAAKRRVQEMHERASRYTDNSQTKRQGSESHSNTYENKPKDIEKTDEKLSNRDENDESQDKSFFIILALILLLSKEDADNTLILVLLYLLL